MQVVGNSALSVNSASVVVNIPNDGSTQQPAVAAAPTTEENGTNINKSNCCMKTRQCLESSVFSFTLGGLFFVGGIILIGIASQLPSGDYFLIGPFCVAAGTILFIRGCINKMAKRQQRREEAEAEQRRANAPLTRAQRSQRNEELALSQENLIIPPDYYESVSPPKPEPVHRQLVNTMSQTMFESSGPLRTHSTVQTIASRPALHRLASVQSQTSFPSMISVAVDTSDLPVQMDTTAQAPPSYDLVTNQSMATSTSEHSDAFYLPTDSDNGVAAVHVSTDTAQSQTEMD